MERLEAQLGAAEGEPTVLGGGITNHNFRARFAGREVVVRLPGNDTELLGSDRSGEREANSLAASVGVAPEVLGHLDDPVVLVTAFRLWEKLMYVGVQTSTCLPLAAGEASVDASIGALSAVGLFPVT